MSIDRLIAPGSQLERLASGFAFTEGPAADTEGNVFFTDQPNDRILKWQVTGQVSTFLHPCGHANGLYFDHQDNLLACADEKNELWSISPDGQITVLVKEYQGKLLNGPNDLWVRPDGGVYFTDPYYPRPYWQRGPMQQDGQHVYYLTPDHHTVIRVTTDLLKPNGIIGTPDGRTLYVADIEANQTYAYDIQPDGVLTKQRLFCARGSDGMTLDHEGNVYLTGDGVQVFNPAGQLIEHIAISDGWTANVTFGGQDRQRLFITASTCIYGLTMRVQGVP